MESSHTYVPIIKKRYFDPAPVAGKIPIYASGDVNSDCVGTKNHEEFWEEQTYYCLNGYTTGGMWLPPRYYYYLNFEIIPGLYGPVRPDFVDVHYEIFRDFDEMKKDNLQVGLIMPKARRKGLSFFGKTVGAYGARFIPGYRMAVAGGLDVYVQGFRRKMEENFNNVPIELQMHIIKSNDKLMQVGYEYKDIQGIWQKVKQATFNYETLLDKATKFEGEFFHDVIFEEMGEFAKADDAYESIRPAMEIGEMIRGNFLMYGTGGNMLKGARSFKMFCDHYKSYRIKKKIILGPRYFFPYYGGARDEKGKLIEKIPNIRRTYPGLRPEQYLGCEDYKAAEEVILKERKLRALNPNKKPLIEWNKKYPLTEEEIFTSSGSNNFNTEKLYARLMELQSLPSPLHKPYKLEFELTKEGEIIMPYRVKAIPCQDNDEDGEIVYIYKHPHKQIKNLEVAGIDGYNEDQSDTTDSLGAMVILARADEFFVDGLEAGKIPIFLYYRRPKRKEKFWLTCFKASVYYNLMKNTNIAAESDMVIQYYKDMAGKKFLSPRPKAFDAPDSQQKHDYGTKMTTYSKPRMLGLLQTHVEDFIHLCPFELIIKDLIAYDDQNIGTDYDSADALGLALIRIVDMKKVPSDDTKTVYHNELPEYIEIGGEIYEADSSDQNSPKGNNTTEKGTTKLDRGRWEAFG